MLRPSVMLMELYVPLDVPKPMGPDIWIVDGPAISFYGLQFSTRMTLIRLANGDLFVHSPIRLTEALTRDIAAMGRVAHLISPNWIHYAYIGDWAAAFPEAIAWASPGVKERAAEHVPGSRFDRDLGEGPPAEWEGQIDHIIVHGSDAHQEVVFFHRASKVLILADLIENFEPDRLPRWLRPLARLAGVADPDGKMPPDMGFTFRKGRLELKAAVEQMIAWDPKAIILAHGRCYETDGVAELRRAFRNYL